MIWFIITAGCLFGACLFSINASNGDKTAAQIRNVFVIIGICSIALFAIAINKENERPIYKYRILVHFLDGTQKEYVIASKDTPKVKAYKGTYWLSAGEEFILGVIRYEVLSKEEIQ